jgi:hypothetical protein
MSVFAPADLGELAEPAVTTNGLRRSLEGARSNWLWLAEISQWARARDLRSSAALQTSGLAEHFTPLATRGVASVQQVSCGPRGQRGFCGRTGAAAWLDGESRVLQVVRASRSAAHARILEDPGHGKSAPVRPGQAWGRSTVLRGRGPLPAVTCQAWSAL